MEYEDLQQRLGVRFLSEQYLEEALTHRSYLNENPDWKLPHNERLEFLGDAVLELVTTDFLFRRYPSYEEGRLTSIRAALVNFQNLSRIARELGVEENLKMSKGEERDTGRARDVILANALEAIIGAVYCDAGYEAAERFVGLHVSTGVDEIVAKNLDKDVKSLFQEIVQERFKVTPIYEVLEESGPEHRKAFRVGVFFNGTKIAEGEGYSKQEAETEAARRGLHVLKTS